MRCNNCGKPVDRHDENRVSLSGSLETAPAVVPLQSHGGRLCLFTLRNIEAYVSGQGIKKQHVNYITVEVLGRNIDRCIDELKQGDYCVVHGYLRIDDLHGVERTRVRAYSFQKE